MWIYLIEEFVAVHFEQLGKISLTTVTRVGNLSSKVTPFLKERFHDVNLRKRNFCFDYQVASRENLSYHRVYAPSVCCPGDVASGSVA